MHKEIRVREVKKGCQEIEENKANKANRDIWVFQEMPVKKENKANKEELENLVSLDFLVKQEDPEILVCRAK